MNEHFENEITPSTPVQGDPHSLNREAFKDAQRVEVFISILREHPLVNLAFERLENELPQDLCYHNVNHTKEVFHHAITLGLRDGLDQNDITLLAIAAAWHDIGFIQQRTQNEPIAASLLEQEMTKRGGYSQAEIHETCGAILDTQIKFNSETRTLFQKATARLSPWLLDADLSNFGRPDFMQKSILVFAEMSGKQVANVEDLNDQAGRSYLTTTMRLLGRHTWHSHAATVEFAAQEQENRALLGLLIAELTDGTPQGRADIWGKIMHQN